jgi:hypothetical protein
MDAHRITRTLLTVTAGLLLSGGLRAAEATTPAAAEPASTTAVTALASAGAIDLPPIEEATAGPRPVAGTADETELVAWAAGRFERAGLTLPEVPVHFHGHRDACDGLAGFAAGNGGRTEIHLCTERDTWSMVTKRTLLHELAHVWAATALDEARRQRFVAMRGAGSWNDPETPWELQGTEQAAEILTWALLDEEAPVVRISAAGPEALAAGYEVLTGAPVPSR